MVFFWCTCGMAPMVFWFKYLKHEARDWNFMGFQVGFQFGFGCPSQSIRPIYETQDKCLGWKYRCRFYVYSWEFPWKIARWCAMPHVTGNDVGRLFILEVPPPPAYAGTKWTHNFKFRKKNLVSKQFVAMSALQSFVSSFPAAHRVVASNAFAQASTQ